MLKAAHGGTPSTWTRLCALLTDMSSGSIAGDVHLESAKGRDLKGKKTGFEGVTKGYERCGLDDLRRNGEGN